MLIQFVKATNSSIRKITSDFCRDVACNVPTFWRASGAINPRYSEQLLSSDFWVLTRVNDVLFIYWTIVRVVWFALIKRSLFSKKMGWKPRLDWRNVLGAGLHKLRSQKCVSSDSAGKSFQLSVISTSLWTRRLEMRNILFLSP